MQPEQGTRLVLGAVSYPTPIQLELQSGMVTDNGSVFTGDEYMEILAVLEIADCPIERRKPSQNLAVIGVD